MEPDGTVKILLVDDQPHNLTALEATLSGPDRALVRARSGEDALRRVLDDDFAVILMDVQMPGMDGFEAAALIRERDRSKHTPIIFLTAFDSSDVQVFKGYSLGAVDFLAKPIIPAVLRSKVAVFVELFQKTEQVRRQADLLVRTQRKEHERELAEQRRRWELERLREEAAREKHAAEVMAAKAEELARTVAQKERAEEQLRNRARQQAGVAELGRRALEGAGLDELFGQAVALVAEDLGVEFARVLELSANGHRLAARSGYGWGEGQPIPAPDGVDPDTFEGRVLGSSEPVVVEDLASEVRFAPALALRRFGVVSALSVAIHGPEGPFGTLGAFSARRRTFAHDDVHFLQSAANVLATAIQRKRVEGELAQTRDELAVQLADMTRLHALGARLSNSLELSTVLEEVLAAVTSLQGSDRGVLMLHDRERDRMTTAASVGFTPEQLEGAGPPLPRTDDADEFTAIIGGSIIVEDIRSDPVFAPHLAEALRAGYRALSATPLLSRSGGLIGTIATYFDRPHRPTERESRLVELYARQAAESIDNARLYREIRDADRRKGEFLAMLSHELRNPLAPILNALHYLRSPDSDADDVEQAREIAERQVRHLTRLVDDLLDVSRISSGKIQLRKETMDLHASVARAAEIARPLIDARRHELRIVLPPDPVRLVADSARVEQVLANLLNNAAKYTEPGGHIDLSAERIDKDVVVRVRDDGIGISPELLPRVFELFTQDERALDRSHGGLGIGLTLVKNLVELHGGSVSVSSEGPGRGSEFVVRLPLGSPSANGDAPRPQAAPEAPEEHDVPRSRRVLVVDDNLDGAGMLARLLKGWGHEVALTHDGPSALDVAPDFHPDVVLLDIGLPGMDGYEVARRLREIEPAERATLIALTGYGQGEDRRRSEEAGFHHHLVKPVDPQVLGDMIRTARPRPQPSAGGPVGA
jgi:signal transduction histidine kinase/DNA-binding response OmpR family regulator